ncbi:MAG: TonB C-terminal domain-containing protein [Candidatus Eisenbacteria bacterium]|uniref:TonB C-terminal domain-containing protein n=1 Tax=Eiseniibacteriota bacterium TaxID=2212470 RepID=A0A849SF91_UNCEI|nr:TonB C-terminal domain-containing protein [Candidatus Eisenbacteria bacterium]
MRGPLVTSLVVHVVLLAVLFVTRPATSIALPGGDAVPVTLIDPAALRSMAPAVAPPPVAPVREPVPEEDGVRIERERPKPKPEPPRETPPKPRPDPRETPARDSSLPTETPPSPAPAGLALPSAAVGTSGLRGDLGVDASEFPFSYYLALVRDRVAARWSPPAGIVTDGRTVRVVVRFRIGRDGRVSAAQIEGASGVEAFDRSALRAITLSDPLPPLPVGYSASQLGVHFGFEWGTP